MERDFDPKPETDLFKTVVIANSRYLSSRKRPSRGSVSYAEIVNSQEQPVSWLILRRDEGVIRAKCIDVMVISEPLSVRVNGTGCSFRISSHKISIYVENVLAALPSGIFQMRIDLEFSKMALRRRVMLDYNSRGHFHSLKSRKQREDWKLFLDELDPFVDSR